MDSTSYNYKDRYYKIGNWMNLTKSEIYYLGAEKNASGWFWGNGKKIPFIIRYWLQTSDSRGNHLAFRYTNSYNSLYHSYGSYKFSAVDGQSKYKYICEIEEKLVSIYEKGMYIDFRRGVVFMIKSCFYSFVCHLG